MTDKYGLRSNHPNSPYATSSTVFPSPRSSSFSTKEFASTSQELVHSDIELMALSNQTRAAMIKMQRFDRYIYPWESERHLKVPVENELRRLEKIKNQNRHMRDTLYDNQLTITCLYNHMKNLYELNKGLSELDASKVQNLDLQRRLSEVEAQRKRERQQADEAPKLKLKQCYDNIKNYQNFFLNLETVLTQKNIDKSRHQLQQILVTCRPEGQKTVQLLVDLLTQLSDCRLNNQSDKYKTHLSKLLEEHTTVERTVLSLQRLKRTLQKELNDAQSSAAHSASATLLATTNYVLQLQNKIKTTAKELALNASSSYSPHSVASNGRKSLDLFSARYPQRDETVDKNVRAQMQKLQKELEKQKSANRQLLSKLDGMIAKPETDPILTPRKAQEQAGQSEWRDLLQTIAHKIESNQVWQSQYAKLRRVSDKLQDRKMQLMVSKILDNLAHKAKESENNLRERVTLQLAVKEARFSQAQQKQRADSLQKCKLQYLQELEKLRLQTAHNHNFNHEQELGDLRRLCGLVDMALARNLSASKEGSYPCLSDLSRAKRQLENKQRFSQQTQAVLQTIDAALNSFLQAATNLNRVQKDIQNQQLRFHKEYTNFSSMQQELVTICEGNETEADLRMTAQIQNILAKLIDRLMQVPDQSEFSGLYEMCLQFVGVQKKLALMLEYRINQALRVQQQIERAKLQVKDTQATNPQLSSQFESMRQELEFTYLALTSAQEDKSRLEQTIFEIERQKNRVQTEVETLKTKQGQLQTQMGHLIKQNREKLDEGLRIARSRIDVLEEACHQQTSSEGIEKTLKLQISQVLESNRGLQSQLQEANQRLMKLKDTLEQIRNYFCIPQCAQNDLQKFLRQMKSVSQDKNYQSEIENRRNSQIQKQLQDEEIARLKQILDKNNADISFLEAQSRRLVQQLTTNQEQYRNSIKKLELAILDSQHRLELESSIVSKLKKNLEAINLQAKGLQTKNSCLMREIQQLREQNHTVETRAANLAWEIQKLNNIIDANQSGFNALVRDNQAFFKQVNQLKAIVHTLQTEISHNKTTEQMLRQDLQTLLEERERLNILNQSNQAEMQGMAQQITKLKPCNKNSVSQQGLEAKVACLTDQKVKLLERIDQLQQQLRQIESSQLSNSESRQETLRQLIQQNTALQKQLHMSANQNLPTFANMPISDFTDKTTATVRVQPDRLQHYVTTPKKDRSSEWSRSQKSPLNYADRYLLRVQGNRIRKGIEQVDNSNQKVNRRLSFIECGRQSPIATRSRQSSTSREKKIIAPTFNHIFQLEEEKKQLEQRLKLLTTYSHNGSPNQDFTKNLERLLSNIVGFISSLFVDGASALGTDLDAFLLSSRTEAVKGQYSKYFSSTQNFVKSLIAKAIESKERQNRKSLSLSNIYKDHQRDDKTQGDILALQSFYRLYRKHRSEEILQQMGQVLSQLSAAPNS